jgi:nucleoside-diphosphate-sugar epimerase
MKVLITGGTGFIGSRLVLRCLESGDEVVVYGQENTAAEKENRRTIEEAGATVILASMTDTDALSGAMQGIDVVFHLAAAQHEANVPDSLFWDVNVKATRQILEIAEKKGVGRFVHGSTIGVYGSALSGDLDESSELMPDNIYGVTKLEGEKAVLQAGGRLPVVVIRISETYGPGDRRLLKLFKAIDKKAFFMIGDGKNVHHLIYVDDLIDGFLAAAGDDRALGEVFVLAGKDIVTTNEMVGTIARVLEKKLLPVRVPLFPMLMVATVMEAVLRPMGIQPPLHRRRMDFFKKGFQFSLKKSKTLLGFEPRHSFYEGVEKTAAWYREQGLL